MNFQNNRVFQKFQKQVKRIVATPEAKKVYCDACKGEFVPNVKDRPTPGGGKQRFIPTRRVIECWQALGLVALISRSPTTTM